MLLVVAARRTSDRLVSVGEKMKASIVVPTYRRPELLGRCLRALLNQNTFRIFSGDIVSYEIIVADNAGEIETCRAVKKIAAAAPVELHYLWAASKCGPAHARNLGWRTARGEIIAFTDDDTIPEENWLAEGIAMLHDDKLLAAVGGKTVVPLPLHPTDYELNESGLGSAEFITANCFCRREALEAVDGFDERFTSAWREDSDLHFRLLEQGMRVGRCERAVVVHPVRPAGFGVSLRQQRKAMLDALLFKKHPHHFRQKIGFFAGRYYLMTAALLIAIVMLAAGYTIGATAFLALWAALTGWFCWQRLRATSRSPQHVLEMIITSFLIPPTAIFWRVFGAVKFRVLFF
jgi:GT2 family glycosyltransferase